MVSHGSVQLTLYEYFKESIVRLRYDGKAPRKLSSAEVGAATLASKAISSMVTTPLVVLRIRQQDPRNTIDSTGGYASVPRAIKTILRREGVRGLYRGLVPTLVRTLPNALLTFLTYEHFSTTLFAAFGEQDETGSNAAHGKAAATTATTADPK